MVYTLISDALFSCKASPSRAKSHIFIYLFIYLHLLWGVSSQINSYLIPTKWKLCHTFSCFMETFICFRFLLSAAWMSHTVTNISMYTQLYKTEKIQLYKRFTHKYCGSTFKSNCRDTQVIRRPVNYPS